MKFLDTLDRWITKAMYVGTQTMLRPSIILIIIILLLVFIKFK